MKQTNHARRPWLRWLPALIWMGVIFLLSSRTGDQLGGMMPWFQKFFPFMTSFDWGHFVSYYILALLMAYAFGVKAERWSIKALIVLLCVLYGVSDEYHQSFVDGRTPDAKDVRNDGIGALLAMLTLSIPYIKRKWRRLAGN
ncbi:VanZ family protein [Paenibacillus daejeonensis]|uniref:VanZ family protein n=1 Tax=Paenibacillus daejeonensis TaxID=135193 RepID=UPI000366C10E|nr:VanZ family protein [Paenibacillus daejeonensis]